MLVVNQFDPKFFLLIFIRVGLIQFYYQGMTFLKFLLNVPRCSMSFLHFGQLELLPALFKLWQFFSLQFPNNCSFLIRCSWLSFGVSILAYIIYYSAKPMQISVARVIIGFTSYVSQSCAACCLTYQAGCFLCFVQFYSCLQQEGSYCHSWSKAKVSIFDS